MKKNLSLLVPIAALCLAGCAGRMATYENDSAGLLLDKGKTVLCLPLDTLHVLYVDNTKAIPDSLFNDSFFIRAANALLSFEVSQNFRLCQSKPDTLDSLSDFRRGGYSLLDKDTANLRDISLRVQSLAKKHGADFIAVPYSCEIRNAAIRPTGWRHDRFNGPSYERPTSYTAKTSFHVQIWDKTGRVIYERTGRSDTGRPFLYSWFNREKKPDADIVKYAKRFYAPPLVKSLYEAIKLAMMVRI
ncbi:MAG TPA: hypothetical protein VLX68_17500 [Chitinivibrionales bacterium]|nr:hypothetical protein [Chitinivibrionales bacterium]